MKCVFVDDEPNMLSAITRQLENRFKIETYNSGDKALKAIPYDPTVAVVVTDYKMPNMNGVELLKKLQRSTPHIVPIMLTGAADLKTAMGALNDGRVFKFLTKPCSPADLTITLDEALKRASQTRNERELLDSTLSGSVKILTDILSTIDPIGFELGRAIRNDAREIAARLEDVSVWEVELAAMLLELGSLVLPTPYIVKFRTTQKLSPGEEKLWDRVPEVGANLIKQVPRLEGVSEIIRRHREYYLSDKKPPVGARLLHILKDIHKLEEKGITKSEAIRSLVCTKNRYDPDILKEVKEYYLSRSQTKPRALKQIRVDLYGLEPGHKVAKDIRTKDGVILVKEGTELNEALIERVRNYSELVGLSEAPVIEQAVH